MKVLQIVGFKNSGKTTLAKKIIAYFSSKNIMVGSLKNHGHGGIPLGIESTDSEEHREAGAKVAGVLGENIFQLSHGEKWDIRDMLEIYELLNIEFILLEGFKELPYPKLLLLRNHEDLSLLTSLENTIAIIKPSKVAIEDNRIPIFDIENLGDICEWAYDQYWEAT